jgi:hypothetical protein
MASEQIIAVASDALRGIVHAALPIETTVALRALAAADTQAGVWLHLFRIAQPPVARSIPVIGADGRRMRTAVQLHLDYLICARADDTLHAHALLGMALAALGNMPVLDDVSMRALLSQPSRLDALLPAALSLQWKALELPLAEQSAVWQAAGVAQQAGMFWRGEALWQAE